MKTADMRKIRRAMEKTQDEMRYEHTLGVAYTAAALAMRYGASVENAQLAGLLHDCAKCLDDDKKIAICEKHNISITEVEKRNPFLLHAKAGSFLAMNKYKVHDSDVINAILNHTTGRPGMSLLEKIIFVADYIEPGRKKAPNLAEIREYGRNTNLVTRKLTNQEWTDALLLMKTHQMIEIPGAIANLEDDTPIYIYGTVNIFCSAMDINELVRKYGDEEAAIESV